MFLGKENNGSKSSAKNQKLAEATQDHEEGGRTRALEQRLQENNNNEDTPAQPGKSLQVFVSLSAVACPKACSFTNYSLSSTDKAAAKIQASFRGYKERHRFHQQKRAAITIQANIRGYLTRKRIANLRR